jgi:serine/threonine protein kinase
VSSLADIVFQSSATFAFIEEIARGGMGIVYLAEKRSEGVSDLVVLKTIRTISDSRIEMLKREANIAAALRHENIVRTYGLEAIPLEMLPAEFQDELNSGATTDARQDTVGKRLMTSLRMGMTSHLESSGESTMLISHDEYSGKRLYLIVMDYIEGWDLRKIHRKHLRTRALLPVMLNAFIVSRICRALEYAHQYIVHRDLSPENILINQQGVTKLMDFGIAVAADQEVFGLAGKIRYMAPEQVSEAGVDSRADIFALGLVAYHLLTGVSFFLPPKGLNFHEQAVHYEHQLETDIIPPHEICTDIPEVYSNIVMKMLQINPDHRYQSAEEVGSDIEKNFLYASGFGPTNNSLAAYLKIFESGFERCTNQDLEQLAFLTNDCQQYRLKREIRDGLYTDKGKAFIKGRWSAA